MVRKAVRLQAGLLAVSMSGALVAPMGAGASELSGGVSVGGMLAGTKPLLAVSPHVAIAWRTDGGLLFAIRDMLSILPATTKGGVGVYNGTSAMLGYTTENAAFSAGPSFSIYSMPACNAARLCGRVVGVSPGGHAQANVYFAGPLGVAVSASVDWVGGISRVLPGDLVAMVVAGPVLRWTTR